jgi:glutaryl-CoA dehydrogenase (non-decarboxylating)
MKMLEQFDAVAQGFRAFAASQVAPVAKEIDSQESIPRHVIDSLAKTGYLASGFPENLGGKSFSQGDPESLWVCHGLMHEALGAVSASVQGLVNVHHMAGSAIARWGTQAQKQTWIPKLTSGEILGALAITEPNVGSDAAAVETMAVREGPHYRLTGTKKWITCGQIADLFVMLANSAEGPVAFLLPRDTPGLTIEPIRGMLGCRGYMLAVLNIDCVLPPDFMLGKPAFGLTHIVATGLDSGRYNLAWGCVGLARACLDASFDYSSKRRQFNSALADFQLVQRMITGMMTDIHAARLMCCRAGYLRAQRDPAAIKESAMAKYFASKMANRVAYDAVQIHGAHGCGPEHPIERYLRDARIMEIIEGSSQVLEIAIARYGYQERT